MKSLWQKIKNVLWAILMVYLAVVVIYNVFFPSQEKRTPQAGDQCGPEHHWVVVGTPLNQDISCEHD